MAIRVRIKSVYGKETIYPACAQAEAFAKLIGQVTLTRRDIGIIKGMGYAVEVMTDKVEL